MVAALASVTILVLPAHLDYHAAEFGLSGFIAVSGYAVARRGGAAASGQPSTDWWCSFSRPPSRW
ncbi:hypothetical protein I551_7541 [Mycobacterium ulcerans str. Harvey]|uniref:Uncharacterized protein n=1 Tax=Mycobacterium ulcerans str. Harvey TaxID=1299332 RepID=A0ABP3A301_MYCUL|nr:hypothetical protein I551_7541 [Mycobacterium ulcerans str. Harvey]